MKRFTFSTFDKRSYLKIFYAPIPVEVDFDTMDNYEFLDAGGIMIDLVHQHNDSSKPETWEN